MADIKINDNKEPEEDFVVKINDKEKFVDEFSELYLNDYFGTFNKTEIEELFIYLLMEHGNLKDMTNFEISIALHIPESKVRTAMYRSQLKYYKYNESIIRRDFFDILSKERYEIIPKGKGGKVNYISITIEQQYLKEALEAKIKKAGKTINGNFNKETLVLSEEAFCNLMLDFFARSDIEGVQEELQKKLKKTGTDFSLKDAFLDFLKNKGLEIGVGALATIISGGNFTLGAIVGALVKQLK